MNKKDLSERDICTKHITPAILAAGWAQHSFREEVKLTKGRVTVRGTIATRIENPAAQGGPKRADYVLYGLPNLPLAVLEAKRNIFEVGHGMQQALDYAEMLDAPFAFSSNGDGFLFHDRTGITAYPQSNKIDNETGWLFATIARFLQDKNQVDFKKVGSRSYYKSRI